MANSEFKDAPPVYGWAIAVAAGVLAFGVALVALDLGGIAAVALGVLVALIVGVIFTLAESKPAAASAAKAASVPAAPAPAPAAASAPASAPVAATALEAKPEPAPQPEAAPAASAAADVEPEKPKGLDAPIGTADDLKRISGVGPVLEGKLNALGFYHFWQIAKWTRAEVEWVDGYLSFKGRIDRDNWIAQATKLAEDSPSKPPA